MTYTPTVWIDGDCVMAADMNNIEQGVDRAQGDVMILRGLLAALPASDPTLVGRLYFATDTSELFRDNGAGWNQIIFDHADLANVTADQHHAGFIALEDNAAVVIPPAADDRIQFTDDGVINADAVGNTMALSVAQAQIDHGSIGGLGDVADHPGYLLLTGTRIGATAAAQDFTNGILIGVDCNLYRSAADTLRTDDSLHVWTGAAVGSAPPSATELLVIYKTFTNSVLVGAQISAIPTYTVAAAYNQAGLGVLVDIYGSANNTGWVRAFRQIVQYRNTAILSNAYGGDMTIWNLGTGRINNAFAAMTTVQNTSTGTIINGYGLYVSLVNSGGGTITNLYGLYVADCSISTTIGHGIYFAANGSKNDINWMGDTNLYRSAANSLTTDDYFGAGGVTPVTPIHGDQASTTAAIPVLTLDQADVDEPFIKFIGEGAGANLTRSIVDDGDVTTATLVGWAKVEVDDVGNQIADQDYFMPLYTLV